jgi:hypothetical protein
VTERRQFPSRCHVAQHRSLIDVLFDKHVVPGAEGNSGRLPDAFGRFGAPSSREMPVADGAREGMDREVASISRELRLHRRFPIQRGDVAAIQGKQAHAVPIGHGQGRTVGAQRCPHTADAFVVVRRRVQFVLQPYTA